MQKLEMIHQFHKLYGQQINPELVSIKYVQDNNKALIEMYFNGALKPNIIDLKFVGGDIIYDENSEPRDTHLLFDPSGDIVDNAKRLIEMDDYTLINCIDYLFSKNAEIEINKNYNKPKIDNHNTIDNAMNNELKSKLITILKDHQKIEFDCTFTYRIDTINLRYGHLVNIDCGGLYHDIENWFYNVLNEFFISKEIVDNYKGWFEMENSELVVYVSFWGPSEPIENSFALQFDEIIKNRIFEKNTNDISVNFDLDQFGNLSNLEVFIEYKSINLTEDKIKILYEYILNIINKNIPTLALAQEIIQLWEVECYDNIYTFKVFSSPIKYNWDDIYY